MKKKLVVLGALAVTAAAAVPALAFENEFHGLYRLRGSVTNFEIAGVAPLLSPTAKHRDFTLFEQRARLQYIAKASDDLKLVTHFEIDSTWGDAAYSTSRGIGGGLAADTVNLETKNVYLDFNIPATPINAKVGIQGFVDAYKGIFIQDDVAGAVLTGKFGPATTTAAFFRTYDKGGASALGKQTVDVYVADAKISPVKGVNVGLSYYGALNDVNSHKGQMTHTFGVNAAAKLPVVDVDAFALYQDGEELYGVKARNLSAWAGQVAAKVSAGPVAVRVAGLYASGENGKNGSNSRAFQNLFASGAAGNAPGSSTSSGVYYSSNMLLLMRSVWAMDSDNALITSTNNGGRGLIAAFAGVDAKLTDKFTLSGNVGHAMVDKKNEAVAGSATERCTNYNIGTELNVQASYALYSNLTATLQGAYVVLGGYPKATIARNPGEGVQNPYLAALMLNYTF